MEERKRDGDPPRVSDMLEYARKNKLRVTRKKLNEALEKDPVYLFNLHQQLKARSSRKYRPVVATNLGYLHGDIGFFPKSRHYSTPKMFRSGFLVCKDVLSRYIYLVVLRTTRKAPSMVSAMETLRGIHAAAGHEHPVRGISFDRERSVMSNTFQAYLRANGIKFTPFKNTRSKAKFAEGAIKLVRTLVARLERHYKQQRADGGKKKSTRRWWNLLGDVAAILNRQEIVVGGKRTGFSPNDVNAETLPDFLSALYKAAPAYSAAQFSIDGRHAEFKFSVGDLVRAKLIVTSSAAIGEKRSETNLTDSVFKIVERYPHVTRRLTLGNTYRCLDVRSGQEERFDEDDLVRTSDDLTLNADRHAPPHNSSHTK